MPQIILRPSSVKYSTTYFDTPLNVENIWDGNPETFATINRKEPSYIGDYFFIKGFNFSSIPQNARINSVVATYIAKTSNASGVKPSFKNYSNYNDILTTTFDTPISDIKKTSTQTLTSGEFELLKTNNTYTSIAMLISSIDESSISSIFIYDAYITVDYTELDSYTITPTLTGNGQIIPSGSVTIWDGDEYSLKIKPTNNDDIVTATKNGVDITSSLVETFPSLSSEQVLGEYTLISGSMQSSGSTYFSSIAGRSYDYTPTTTNNYYSANSSTIAIFTYNMSMTDIPTGATIISCYLKVTGKCESTSNANEYMCVSLVDNNDNEIIPEFNFKTSGSTSLSTQTLNATTMPTASQLGNAKLKCRLGYYGGNIIGATLFVEFSGESIHQYTYTYEVDEDATINVTIQSPPKVVKLYPSIFTRSNTSYLTLVDEANITDNNDTTYGTLNHTRNNSTTAYYLYCGGFDFSSIPEGYVVDSVVAKVVANVTSAATNQKPTFYNNTTSASTLGTFSTNIGTSKTTSTVNMTVANFNTFKGYGNNARIRLYLNRSSKNTASNMKIYEVYLEVTCIKVSTTKNIKIGSSQVDKLYIGTSEVDKIYIGTTVVYEK